MYAIQIVSASGLEKITVTQEAVPWLENASFSTRLYSCNQSEEAACFCYYKGIGKTENEQESNKPELGSEDN